PSISVRADKRFLQKTCYSILPVLLAEILQFLLCDFAVTVAIDLIEMLDEFIESSFIGFVVRNSSIAVGVSSFY
mgnify:CR=1